VVVQVKHPTGKIICFLDHTAREEPVKVPLVDPAHLQKVLEDIQETLKQYPVKMLLLHDSFQAPQKSKVWPKEPQPFKWYVESGPTWEEQELRILEDQGLLHMVCHKNRDPK